MLSKAEKQGCYEIKGEKYTLPPPTLLKSLNADNTALLDTWPSYATGRNEGTGQVVMTKNFRFNVVNDHDLGYANLVPKPRFLEQLENYLSDELRRQNVLTIEPNTVRLKIHQEVFEYLIEAFKMYKPLLAAIKREYELMLTHYVEEIKKLEPLQGSLWILSQESELKIVKMRESESEEITNLRMKNQQLQQTIIDMLAEKADLESQIEKLSKEVSEIYRTYRDEADARKLLINNINELRTQLEDMGQFRKNAEKENRDDPVTLKIALTQAKLAHSEVQKQLNETLTNYCDVIPRRDFESLQLKFAALDQDHIEFKVQFEKLQVEHRSLLDIQHDVVKQRDQYYTEVETLRRAATPRPDWQRCADVVYGGMEKWREMSHDKSSNELVDILLQEISQTATSPDSIFVGRGFDPIVPIFLRYEGEVRNRKMQKRDCRIYIRELWNERKIQKDDEAQAIVNGQDYILQNFSEFVLSFFNKIYGLELLRVEWCYSFYDALVRFAEKDEYVAQFLGIINCNVDEESYWEEIRVMGKLMDEFRALDHDNNLLIKKDDFMQILITQYPNKDPEFHENIYECAINELSAKDDEYLEYTKLFLSDDEGDFGDFLKTVRNNYKAEKKKYVDEIRKELQDIGSNTVRLADVKRTLLIVDPSIDQTHLEAYLSWTFKCSKSELIEKEESNLDLNTVVQRLQDGNVTRFASRT